MSSLIEKAVRLRKDSLVQREQSRESLRMAVKLLRDDGMTMRETAAVLGISHQRVWQIESAGR